MGFELDPSYKDVAARQRDLAAKHPEGSTRVLDPAKPYSIEVVDGRTFIVVVVQCFRHPLDPAPATGMAWEPFPGKTPYTRDSELQNAETSATGRAIVNALASESKSIASAEDVRNRRADAEVPMATKEQVDQIVSRAKALDDTERSALTEWRKAEGIPAFSSGHVTYEQAESALCKLTEVEDMYLPLPDDPNQ